MNAVDEKVEYLGSSVIGNNTYNYFRGSDLYVYQFHGDKKLGYLCHISAWPVFSLGLNVESPEKVSQ